MQYKILYFSQSSRQEWDNYIKQILEASYLHSWSWIHYLCHFDGVKENLSCLFIDNGGNPLAVVPIAVTYNNHNGFAELSFGGTSVGVPALNNVKPSHRRKLLDDIFSFIQDIMRTHQLKKIHMCYYPLTISRCAGQAFGDRNSFEFMRYQLFPQVNNISVIDLSITDEVLQNNICKFHRKNIRKAMKANIKIKTFNIKENHDRLMEYFKQFQKCHLLAAGRMTRPQSTWDAMYTALLNGDASLFVAFIEEQSISFLYCGEFFTMAFGWSQANVKAYEEQYPVRHLLEWEAICYYKKNDFKYYDIGDRFYKYQMLYNPTEKEISIGLFKERYGGFLIPKVIWFGYMDSNLLKQEYDRWWVSFVENHTLSVPEK